MTAHSPHTHYVKHDFAVEQVRRFLEPGPITLISSYHDGEADIMAHGWHTVLEFTPSLVGCMIASANHSFELIRKSKECVINLPTADMARTVVGIGNTSGTEIDKFAQFGLTKQTATHVKAPLIAECYANFECKLHDDVLVKGYNFFIFKVVKAHVARSPKNPKTLHYRGDGEFMVSGATKRLRRYFKPEML